MIRQVEFMSSLLHDSRQPAIMDMADLGKQVVFHLQVQSAA
jgi:hypothetical protein